MDKPLPGWLGAMLVGVTFAVLFWRELRSPLRRSVEGKLRRTARNFAMASLGGLALKLTESPVTRRLTALVQRRRWGLLKQVPLPSWLETLLGVLLLDYTLYWWHILTHKVPLLWRFHQVHHVDLDLDASTALRFHFGELVLSVAWRAGQVVLIGISPRALSLWSVGLLMEIMFHHSNAELPIRLERWLNWLLVTPRMHGIHHSIVQEETNSNWSSGLTLWDWLHGTLRLNVPQQAITIGVPAYRNPKEVTLPKLIEMPFGEQRPSWQLPGNERPAREPLRTPYARLLASDLPMPTEQLLVFVRAPRAGQVKTRLAEALGDDAACGAYRQLVQTVLGNLSELPAVQLHYTPSDAAAEIEGWLRPGWESRPQVAGDLGQRLQAAFLAAFRQGAQRVVAIGSDCPAITAQDIQAAWRALASVEVVLGPARDGGYWLIGLRQPQPALFENTPWSTAEVCRETRKRAQEAGVTVRLLRELADVDTLPDWQAFLQGQFQRSL